MPSAKKLVAAAAHLRQQADVLAERVDKQHDKLARFRELLVGVEADLAQAEIDADDAEKQALEAEEAAQGLDTSVFPDVADVGVRQ